MLSSVNNKVSESSPIVRVGVQPVFYGAAGKSQASNGLSRFQKTQHGEEAFKQEPENCLQKHTRWLKQVEKEIKEQKLKPADRQEPLLKILEEAEQDLNDDRMTMQDYLKFAQRVTMAYHSVIRHFPFYPFSKGILIAARYISLFSGSYHFG